MYRALKRLPLQLENNGEGTRDFIYVEDIVRGLLLCAVKGEPGDVYNLASGIETSILELATIINQMTGNTAPMGFLAKRTWDHSVKRFGSTEKAMRTLGFAVNIPLKDGLHRTTEWTRQNIQTIDACILKHADRMRASRPFFLSDDAINPAAAQSS